jgi:hypothetical protein
VLEVLQLKGCAARIKAVVQSAEAMLQRPCGPAEYGVLFQALEGPLSVFRAAGTEPPASSLVMGELRKRISGASHPLTDAERRTKGDPLLRWLQDLVRESDLAAQQGSYRFKTGATAVAAALGGALWVATAKTPEEKMRRAMSLRDGWQRHVDRMKGPGPAKEPEVEP